MLAAVIIWFVWFCAPDGKGIRKTVPWGFVIFGVAAILIGLWVIIYICFIYKKDKVYVKDYNRYEDEDDHPRQKNSNGLKPGYVSKTKAMYIIDRALFTILNGAIFLYFSWRAFQWEERHRNQERAYG